VFLDEIGEMALPIQAKLLTVFEEKRVMRLAAQADTVDVRFIFATNRDLEAEMERGAFREDFYDRIDEARIEVAPLRERVAEIEPLARKFIAEVSKEDGRASPPALSPAALDKLKRFSWPAKHPRPAHRDLEGADQLPAGRAGARRRALDLEPPKKPAAGVTAPPQQAPATWPKRAISPNATSS